MKKSVKFCCSSHVTFIVMNALGTFPNPPTSKVVESDVFKVFKNAIILSEDWVQDKIFKMDQTILYI